MQTDQPFAALHAPVAPLTWEVQAALQDTATTRETQRIPLDFRGPLEIVGLYPSVIRTSNAGALVIPTTQDILCLIDINNEERLTNRLEQPSGAGPGSSYVTLAALSTLVPRLLRKQLTNARPNINIQFRWKNEWTGAQFYEHALISLAFFVRYLEEPAR